MVSSTRRVRGLLTAICIFVAAGAVAQVQTAPSQPDPAAVETLLSVASDDFRLASAARPTAIRNAKVGYLADAGVERYLLCGSFRTASKDAAWVQFATIKTEPYEQWLGGMAEAQCANKRIVWYEADHSDALLQRISKK